MSVPTTGQRTERPDHVSRRSSRPAISPSSSKPNASATFRKGRSTISADASPSAVANSAEIDVKHPSAPVRQTNFTGVVPSSALRRATGSMERAEGLLSCSATGAASCEGRFSSSWRKYQRSTGLYDALSSEASSPDGTGSSPALTIGSAGTAVLVGCGVTDAGGAAD